MFILDIINEQATLGHEEGLRKTTIWRMHLLYLLAPPPCRKRLYWRRGCGVIMLREDIVCEPGWEAGDGEMGNTGTLYLVTVPMLGPATAQPPVWARRRKHARLATLIVGSLSTCRHHRRGQNTGSVTQLCAHIAPATSTSPDFSYDQDHHEERRL